MLRLTRLTILACTAVLLAGPTLYGQGATGQDPTAREPHEQRQRDRVWNQHWPRFASRFQQYGDTYHYFPTFDPQNDNSSGLTRRDARQSIRVEWVPNPNRVANRVMSRPVYSPDEDVDTALRTLSAYEPGAYGYIESCKIIERISDTEAVIAEVQLINEDTLNRQRNDAQQLVERELSQLAGLRTDPRRVLALMFEHRDKAAELQKEIAADPRPLLLRGFDRMFLDRSVPPIPAANQVWRGPIPIAIIGEEDGKLIAVPPRALTPVRTEEQFLDLLEQAQFDQDRFIDAFLELVQRRISLDQINLRLDQRLAGTVDDPLADIDLREVFE